MCSTSERTLVSTVIDVCYVLSQWQLLLLPVSLPVVFGFICPSNEDLEAPTEERERAEQKERASIFNACENIKERLKSQDEKNKTDKQHAI